MCVFKTIKNFPRSLFSKKILTLGAKEDPPPHPKSVQLQRMIRYSATLFVQVRQQKFNVESDISYAYFVLIAIEIQYLIKHNFAVINPLLHPE